VDDIAAGVYAAAAADDDAVAADDDDVATFACPAADVAASAAAAGGGDDGICDIGEIAGAADAADPAAGMQMWWLWTWTWRSSLPPPPPMLAPAKEGSAAIAARCWSSPSFWPVVAAATAAIDAVAAAAV